MFCIFPHSWTMYWILRVTLRRKLFKPTTRSSQGLTFGLWA